MKRDNKQTTSHPMEEYNLSPYVLREEPGFLARALAPAMIADLGSGGRDAEGNRISGSFLVAQEREKLYKTKLRDVEITLIEESAGLPIAQRQYRIYVDDGISGINNLYYHVLEQSQRMLEESLRKLFVGLQNGCLPGMKPPEDAAPSTGKYIVLTDAPDLAEAIMADQKMISGTPQDSKKFLVAKRRDSTGSVFVKMQKVDNNNSTYLIRMYDDTTRHEVWRSASKETLVRRLRGMLNDLKKDDF